MSSDSCVIEGCCEEMKYTGSGLCVNCYAALYYWKGATPTELMDRAYSLSVFQSRIESMLGNVRSIKRRKRVAAG